MGLLQFARANDARFLFIELIDLLNSQVLFEEVLQEER